jgi:nucleoside-diphosphate-sugar epimerase
VSPYAASKKAAEVLCHSYHALFGLDCTVLRYFTVYGPAGRPDMSPFRFVQWIREGRPLRILGNGTQSRDFTHVDDIARGTVAALNPLGYEIINLGSDSPVVLLEMVQEVERLTGRCARLQFLPPQAADVPATWADIGKARDMLGWAPCVPFREGLRSLVSWYEAERGWAATVETAD